LLAGCSHGLVDSGGGMEGSSIRTAVNPVIFNGSQEMRSNSGVNNLGETTDH
jgi:hypothetical protein